MGRNLGQHGSSWRKRPRGDGPWRACAGLTSGKHQARVSLSFGKIVLPGGLPILLHVVSH